MKLLRMDTKSYPMRDFERELYLDAGIGEIVEIDDDDPEAVVRIDADVLSVIPGYLPGAVLERLSNCRMIIRLGAGYDKIDLDMATRKGIYLIIVPDYCVHEVAEHIVMLMLSIARKLIVMNRAAIDGSWMQARKDTKLSRLHGKTLGILGFGRIGRQVGRIAHSMGMDVLIYDVAISEQPDYQVERVDMDTLLKTATSAVRPT